MKRALFGLLGSYKYLNYRFVFEMLIDNCAKNGSLVLDAGCGQGSSISCPPDGAEFVGIDILHSNVAECRQQWEHRSYVIGDLSMLPFADGIFGGAISADVLEHVENKTLAVSELSRVTKRGGFFVGCSSNIFNPALWLDVKVPLLIKPLERKLAPRYYERHSRFGPTSLKKTLDSTGYRMDDLYLIGAPQFLVTPSLQWVARLWILFDRITNKKILQYFKEILVWSATRV